MKKYSKQYQILATIIMVVGFLFFLVKAEAQEITTIVYEQSPGHFGGFSSDGQTITVADEFQLDQTIVIQNITWWGGYLSTNLPLPVADSFTIHLFTDDAGKPGALVQTFNVKNNASRVATGSYVNPPFIDPPFFVFPGRAEYKYSFDLPQPFVAHENTRYWLSIVNVPTSDSWVWEVSGSLINLGVQRTGDSVLGPWEPYFDNTAFQLGTRRVIKNSDGEL